MEDKQAFEGTQEAVTDEATVEKQINLFGHAIPRRRAVMAGAAAMCIAALAGGGAWWAVNQRPQDIEPVKVAATTEAGQAQIEGCQVIEIGAQADGWDATSSSPIIVHVVKEEAGVDYYHAYEAGKSMPLEVSASGDYKVSFISPINADGSIYRVPGETQVSTGSSGVGEKLPFTFEHVKAEDVKPEEITGITEAVAEAVKKGDETLTGENGVKVVETVKNNGQANPNADKEAVEKEAQEATQTVNKNASEAKGNTPNNNVTNKQENAGEQGTTAGGENGAGQQQTQQGDGNSGNNTAENKQPAHSHNWAAQTQVVHHDAEYKTVHHDAEYKTVHHDAVVEYRHICNNCGADITGAESSHMEASLVSGGNCGSYHTAPVTVQAAYDETVLVKDAWTETVVAQPAWDETVTTGYRCTGCGATK